jgi:hypothetical protein
MSCSGLNIKQLQLILEIVKKTRTRKISKKTTTVTKKEALKMIKNRLETTPPVIKRKKRKTIKKPLLLVSGKNDKLKLFALKGKGYYYPESQSKKLIFRSGKNII